MTPQIRYSEYLKTDYWKAVSLEVKKRAGFRCQLCNSQMDLVAHHRCYDHRGNELEHLGDLICLCARCHSLFHGIAKPEQIQPPKPVRREDTKQPTAGNKHRKHIEHTQADIDKDMPPGEGPIVLTRELVDLLRTNGSFTNSAIIPLGITRKTRVKGWCRELVGKEVSRETYAKCLAGRYEYNGKIPKE